MTISSWNRYTKKLFRDESLGFFLDLNHAGVKDADYKDFLRKFSHAFAQMDALEAGSIANPDEARQVGHYWLRSPDLAPTPAIASLIETTLKRVLGFSTNIITGETLAPNGKPFSHLLLIGIGGSALGPQFILDALGQDNGLVVDYIDNTDPEGIDSTLSRLDQYLPSTLVCVISKSGGTAETRNGMLEVEHHFGKNGLSLAKQAVAITGTNSQLHRLAVTNNWLDIFPMWDWVGGRTSVFSAVGLLPAALSGVDIQAFLDGAAAMDQLTRNHELESNPSALLALAWLVLGNAKGDKDMVILPYKDKLLLFSRYLQQLIMESLGKRLDLDGNIVHQGIAVYGNKGSTDQHAYVQQLRDGLNNFFITFIEVLKDRNGDAMLVDEDNSSGDYLFGFLKGTETALSESDRRSLTITIADTSPRSIGALIALYERAVGLYAAIVNINAYHQPGVEAGKKAAGEVLELKNRIVNLLKEQTKSLSVEEICKQLHLVDHEILVYQIIRHHLANNDLKVEGSIFHPETLRIGL
jgi:glucose-6-phosphate isomerase